jgi:hypothetical protein
VTITLTGNNITSNHFGVWLGGPVIAANAATANSYTSVSVPVSVN